MTAAKPLPRAALRSSLGHELQRSLDMPFTVHLHDMGHVVEIPLPGVRRQDVVVEVEARTLTVRVSLEREMQHGEPGVVVEERHAGTAMRTFAFAETIDTAAARASMEHGVLRVFVPRGQGGAKRQLEL